jgi:hypothetical protein
MRRENRFLISRKQFAIDLSTITGTQNPRGAQWSFSGSANAVWYRRKDGVTRACLGTMMLFSHHLLEPVDVTNPHAILSADLDGRYGGDCHARWDGEHYWGSQKPAEQALHLTVLEPMLANYPVIPDGHDGWWTFQEAR